MYRYNSTGLDPWEGGGAGGGAGPGAAQRMTMDQIRADQQAMIDDQDRGLDELSKALRRQQQMGLDMQDEIQEHNGMVILLTLSPGPSVFGAPTRYGRWWWYSNGTGSLEVLHVHMVQGRQTAWYEVAEKPDAHSGTVIP